MTPTARTLRQLRKDGWEADVVERWIPGANVRRDFFGCIDVIAVHEMHGILGVQATTKGCSSARVKKLLAEPRLRKWLIAGGKCSVWGWTKKGARWKAVCRAIRLENGEVVAEVLPRKKRERKLFR